MAMTGVLRITSRSRAGQKPAPEQIATEGVPALLAHVAPEHRETATELIHWGVGAIGGVGFGILPAGVRRRRWVGAAYGLAILGVFEVVVAPWLGFGTKDRAVSER